MLIYLSANSLCHLLFSIQKFAAEGPLNPEYISSVATYREGVPSQQPWTALDTPLWPKVLWPQFAVFWSVVRKQRAVECLLSSAHSADLCPGNSTGLKWNVHLIVLCPKKRLAATYYPGSLFQTHLVSFSQYTQETLCITSWLTKW